MIVSCKAPLGEGGLGWHLKQVVEEARGAGTLSAYFSLGVPAGDRLGRRVRLEGWLQALHYTPLRFLSAWRNFTSVEIFDRLVAADLEGIVRDLGSSPGKSESFHGFDGQSLQSFRKARELGFESLILESATSHASHVLKKAEQAQARLELEGPGFNSVLERKILQEYRMADLIYVSSQYSWESFVEQGIPSSKLRLRRLRVADRFQPGDPKLRQDGRFRVAYVGSLTQDKGVPILIQAFVRLADPNAELWLVGFSSSRPMAKFLSECRIRDPRIHVGSGDPLPFLHKANVLVHPSFQDGFGLAPMEALACGVPVIVTEDTGMKEHVREGKNGYIVPTGDADAILDRLQKVRAGALSGQA